MYELMAMAIDRSRGRWGQDDYATRIAVSSIIGPDWASETGWGLLVDEFSDNEYPFLLADWATLTVYEYPVNYAHTGKKGFQSAMDMEPSNVWTFDEFVDAHKPSLSVTS